MRREVQDVLDACEHQPALAVELAEGHLATTELDDEARRILQYIVEHGEAPPPQKQCADEGGAAAAEPPVAPKAPVLTAAIDTKADRAVAATQPVAGTCPHCGQAPSATKKVDQDPAVAEFGRYLALRRAGRLESHAASAKRTEEPASSTQKPGRASAKPSPPAAPERPRKQLPLVEIGLVAAGCVAIAVVTHGVFWGKGGTTTDTTSRPAASSQRPVLEYRDRHRGRMTPAQVRSLFATTDTRRTEDDLPRSSPPPESLSEATVAQPSRDDLKETAEPEAPPTVLANLETGRRRRGRAHKPSGAKRGRGPAKAADTDVTREDDAPFDFATLFGEGGSDASAGSGTAKRSRKAPLPVGADFKVRLEMGITSTQHGRVLARVLEDVRAPGHRGIALPKGTILIGSSSNDDARIYVTFRKARHDASGRSWDLQALATSQGDKGIAAQRREASLEERQEASVAKGSTNVAKELIRQYAGGVGRAVVDASEGAVDEAQRDNEVDRSVVLTVAAGVEFDVVVTD